MAQSRYLSPEAVGRLARKKKRQQIWGWVLTIFFALSVVLSLTEKENQTIINGLPLYAACLAASAFLLWCSFRSAARLAQAQRYGSLFAQDRNGVVTAAELARANGLPEFKARAQLEKLFRLGLFQNCALETGGELRVVLSDASFETKRAGFVNVRCASCGGTSRIRADTVGVCEYCGSPIKAE